MTRRRGPGTLERFDREVRIRARRDEALKKAMEWAQRGLELSEAGKRRQALAAQTKAQRFLAESQRLDKLLC